MGLGFPTKSTPGFFSSFIPRTKLQNTVALPRWTRNLWGMESQKTPFGLLVGVLMVRIRELRAGEMVEG